MPTLYSVIKINGRLIDLVAEAKPGEIVDLVEIPADIRDDANRYDCGLDYKPTMDGVVYYHSHKGYFRVTDSGAVLIHNDTRPVISWFPFGENKILTLTGTNINLLANGAKPIIVYDEDWFECKVHPFTDTVVLTRKERQVNLLIHPDAKPETEPKNVLEKTTKSLLAVWTKLGWRHRFHDHISRIPRNEQMMFKYGHPDGISYMAGNTVYLMRGNAEEILHACKKERYGRWSVSKEGFIDETSPQLSFNEDPEKVFFKGVPDKLLHTVSGTVVVSNGKLYFPFEAKPFAHIPWGITAHELMGHPFGATFEHDGWIKLIVCIRPIQQEAVKEVPVLPELPPVETDTAEPEKPSDQTEAAP